MSEFLHDMSRPAGELARVDVNWLFPDHDETLPVYLIVVRARVGAQVLHTPTARDQHWMFIWEIGETNNGDLVHRRVHIAQELGCDHLTNWGPITTTAGRETTSGTKITVMELTLAQRLSFEDIASTTKVRKPDGHWNCQDWCETVLQSSVDRGLLTHREMSQALTFAWDVEPYL